VEFARALANISIVLPSRVTRGLKEAGGIPIAEGGKLRKSKGYAARRPDTRSRRQEGVAGMGGIRRAIEALQAPRRAS
jgi:hypothetical protein